MTFEISKHDYSRLLGIACKVAGYFNLNSIAADLCQEYIADLIDGRFIWNGKTTHPYKIMMHYLRTWEKPRTLDSTKYTYWMSCSRKPILPSDFFELKELWESASEAEKNGIFSLMISYGSVENKQRGKQGCAERSALYRFRKRRGIKKWIGPAKPPSVYDS